MSLVPSSFFGIYITTRMPASSGRRSFPLSTCQSKVPCITMNAAQLWLWANNAALNCLAFTKFASDLADSLWTLHQRSIQFREEMFLDDVHGPEWGSW
jgi:hypothetical protein